MVFIDEYIKLSRGEYILYNIYDCRRFTQKGVPKFAYSECIVTNLSNIYYSRIIRSRELMENNISIFMNFVADNILRETTVIIHNISISNEIIEIIDCLQEIHREDLVDETISERKFVLKRSRIIEQIIDLIKLNCEIYDAFLF